MAATRRFAESNPNTVKAFLKGYLDGLRRALDDRDYAVSVAGKLTRVEDPNVRLQDYGEGRRTWNVDLTVDRAAIEVVLENSPLPNARDANPDDFYDNRLSAEVNATYAARLFPETFGRR